MATRKKKSRRKCGAKSQSDSMCRLQAGHDPPHIGPNVADPESSVWWFDRENQPTHPQTSKLSEVMKVSLEHAHGQIPAIAEEIQSALAEVVTAQMSNAHDFECEVASAIISLEQIVRDLREISQIRIEDHERK